MLSPNFREETVQRLGRETEGVRGGVTQGFLLLFFYDGDILPKMNSFHVSEDYFKK